MSKRLGTILYLTATAVMLMCVVDALFTAYHVQVGGEEINPVMNWVLQQGAGAFVCVKLAITGLCLVPLAGWYERYRIARYGFWLIFIGYVILSMYHVTLAVTHW